MPPVPSRRRSLKRSVPKKSSPLIIALTGQNKPHTNFTFVGGKIKRVHLTLPNSGALHDIEELKGVIHFRFLPGNCDSPYRKAQSSREGCAETLDTHTEKSFPEDPSSCVPALVSSKGSSDSYPDPQHATN